MTYFPADVFQIILSYAGIFGMTTEQVKLFNRVDVNRLLQLFNHTFQGNVLKLKSRIPALEKRKIILKVLFSSLKYNKPTLFQDMLTLYNLEYKPPSYIETTSCMCLYREYCVEFDNRRTPKLCGAITKINKASFYIRPFAHSYEILDIQHLIAVKIYNPNHILSQPVMVKLSKVDSITIIHSGNRNSLLQVRMSMIHIPVHEQHLISYI